MPFWAAAGIAHNSPDIRIKAVFQLLNFIALSSSYVTRGSIAAPHSMLSVVFTFTAVLLPSQVDVNPAAWLTRKRLLKKRSQVFLIPLYKKGISNTCF